MRNEKLAKAMAIMLATATIATSGVATNLSNACAAQKVAALNAATQAQESVVNIDNNEEINDYFDSLKYDKSKILASEIDETTGQSTKTTYDMKDKSMTVTRKEVKKVENKSSDLVAINAIASDIYPGQLVLANRELVEGDPTEIVTKDRAPITVTLSLNGGGKLASRRVENPSRSNVKEAVDEIVEDWGKTKKKTTADSKYEATMVSSSNQLDTSLGIKDAAETLGIDMKAIVDGKKQAMVISYRQVYFNVTVSRETNLFGPKTTLKDIKKVVTNEAPAAMVSNVSYGRMIYVVLETNSSDMEVEEAFNATLKGVKIDQNAKYKKIMENTSFTAHIFGGTADGSEKKVVKKSMDAINELIENEASYEGPEKSAAFPIGYKTKFVKDNSSVKVNDTTTYVETKYEKIDSTQVNLSQGGAYIVKKWYVTAQKIEGFDKNGNEILGKEETFYQDTNACAWDDGSIRIPANYTNIKFGYDIRWGADWPYRGTVCKGHAKKIDISIWGTTYNPGHKIMVDGVQVARRR